MRLFTPTYCIYMACVRTAASAVSPASTAGSGIICTVAIIILVLRLFLCLKLRLCLECSLVLVDEIVVDLGLRLPRCHIWRVTIPEHLVVGELLD